VNDAVSEIARRLATEWFCNIAPPSELDDPAKSLVCLAMQQLCVGELSGIRKEQGWPKPVLPAIGVEAADYRIAED
jgi:hypothetical protein